MEGHALCFRTPDEFSTQLKAALVNEPHPMRPEERRKLTWEDATERFLDVAELKPGERPKGWEEACDKLTWNAFNSISGALFLPSVAPLRHVATCPCPKCAEGWEEACDKLTWNAFNPSRVANLPARALPGILAEHFLF